MELANLVDIEIAWCTSQVGAKAPNEAIIDFFISNNITTKTKLDQKRKDYTKYIMENLLVEQLDKDAYAHAKIHGLMKSQWYRSYYQYIDR
jgi:hypothetical protein